MITHTEKSYSVGKYLVSPSSQITESGAFTASLSIRSGRGSGTHDRVFRFIPTFSTREGALTYAATEGRSLLRQQYAV